MKKFERVQELGNNLKLGKVSGTFEFALSQFTNSNQNQTQNKFSGRFNNIEIIYE